jgi:dCMP deaminase
MWTIFHVSTRSRRITRSILAFPTHNLFISPGNDCAKVIIQSQIQEVIYRRDCHHDQDVYRASRILLEMAGVKTRQYSPVVDRIDLDFGPWMPTKIEQEGFTPIKTAAAAAAADVAEKEEQYRALLLREANYEATTSSKRRDYLSWDDYFMAMAFLTAQRSKDPNTQVGACIINQQNCIIGLGYNGFPRGCSDDHLPWTRTSESSRLHTKYPYVCHAEVNAILNKCSADVQNATLYVALFPCNECAKVCKALESFESSRSFLVYFLTMCQDDHPSWNS